MRKIYWLLILVLLFTACDRQEDATPAPENSGGIQWARAADAIVVRLEARRYDLNPVQMANLIPPCTLWGDGHLVWLNPLPGETQVLEARLDDATIRSFIQFIVGTGFYGWQSNFLYPDNFNPEIQSIRVSLYENDRTVSRYTADWPVDGYNTILNRCRALATQPVLYLPAGGWLSAATVEQAENTPTWQWSPETAGFALADLTEPRWLTGEALVQVWQNTIVQPAYALENNQAYQLTLQVPGLSRESPPAQE